MAQGILVPFAPVHAPTDRPAVAIKDHRRHGDFLVAHPLGPSQQALHPEPF
jgi:hypothetical protein